MDVGHLLKTRRTAAGVTQAELGRRVQVTSSVISAYEHGAREPKAGVFLELLQALGVESVPVREIVALHRSTILLDVLYLAEALPNRHRPLLMSPLSRSASKPQLVDGLRNGDAKEWRCEGIAMNLPEKIVAITRSLFDSSVPYAIGGALALAYATEEPRGTRDIDINIFISADRCEEAFRSLPAGVQWSDLDVMHAKRDDQVRIWWEDTPVDVFFSAHEFHEQAATRTMQQPFLASSIYVLAPVDLGVFKALFDRSKDWVDIEAMLESRSTTGHEIAAHISRLLGVGDPRIQRLLNLD